MGMATRTRALMLSFVMTGSCLLSGCPDEEEDEPLEGQQYCTEDEDCPSGWYCIEGYCHSTECLSDDTDDPGGGCPEGFYCSVDGVCSQDCVTNHQCVEIHGLFWVCNECGQCEYAGSDSDT